MPVHSVIVAVTLLGCGGLDCEPTLSPTPERAGTEAPFEGYDPESCLPDRAMWGAAVAPVVEVRCGDCHGAEPRFGAPNALVAYDALVEGAPGNRPVDRIARRVVSGTMPPPSHPPLDHGALDLLVGWATCGEVHPDPAAGLRSSREPYTAVVPANADLPSFDVLAADEAIGPDTLDAYRCFAIDVPLDEPRFVRRMQVVLDDARVLHHVVLHHDPAATTAGRDRFACDDGSAQRGRQLWAWAPGTGAFDFEEGGLELKPEERLVLEIHYNNGAGLRDVTDRSGVRIFHGPVEGPAWSLIALGPETFEVPEGDSAVCDASEVFASRRLLASLPHMHEVGAEFESWIARADGRREELVKLTGWSFEAQRFYHLDQTVDVGDVIHTRCGYRNTTGDTVQAGLRTEDEMCFDFVFVGPP